jgi:hypothetical protein
LRKKLRLNYRLCKTMFLGDVRHRIRLPQTQKER